MRTGRVSISIAFVLVLLLLMSGVIISGVGSVSASGSPVTVQDNFSTDSGLWTYTGTAFRDAGNEHVVLARWGFMFDAGQIWLGQSIKGPFLAKFRYWAGGEVPSSSADGLVFMFYKQTGYVPQHGGSLTFIDGFWVPGYGIEFDSWPSREWNDPSPSHIALIKDTPGNHLLSINDPRTEDWSWHDVTVEVTSSSITVWLDGDTDAHKILEWSGIIDTTHGGIGFGASTGAFTNWHIIDDVSITYYESGNGPPVEVGGEVYPVDRLAILIPGLTLAVILIAGAAVVMRRRMARR